MAAFMVFLLLVGATSVFGASFQPGDWYAGLRKPPLTPPGWVFPPVWTALYVAIGVAGWLVWRERRRVGAPLLLWGAQLALNGAWSPLFFGLQRPGLALIEILVLLAAAGATAVAFFRVRPLAGWLFVPYAAWIAFATYLTAGVWALNRA